jgi:type IV fimbrial biogenesis protein FimT
MFKKAGLQRMGTRTKGFTLVELMIVIGIMGIIMLFAVPNFIEMIANNRISSSTSDFIGSLQLAKTESVARVTPVSICKKNSASTACVTGGDWEQGWIVFIDANSNGAVNAGDTVLQAHEALHPRITFRGTTGVADFINYTPSGRSSITGTEVLMMCDDRGYSDSALGILITITGRGNALKAANTGETTCL